MRHALYIPEGKLAELEKFRRIQTIKIKENGSEPSDAEVVEKMGIEASEIPELRWLAGLEFISMDQPIDSDEPVEIHPESPQPVLHETLPSPHPSVEEEFFSQEKRTVIMEGLESLTPKEKQILELRYGLGEGEEMTQEETGKLIGVSRHRVAQIEAQALGKLRHPSRSNKLKDHLS